MAPPDASKQTTRNVRTTDSQLTQREAYTRGSMVGASVPRATRTPLAVGDVCLSVLVVLLATWFAEGSAALGEPHPLGIGLIGAIVLPLSLWWRRAYAVNRSVRWDGNAELLLQSIIGVSLAMVVGNWLLDAAPARLWQVLVTGGWILALGVFRLILRRRTALNTEPVRVIVAGSTREALAVRLALRADGRTAYDVQGFVVDRLDDDVPEIVSRMALGSIDQLPHVAEKLKTELVVMCMGAVGAEERFATLVRAMNFRGIEVALSTGLSNVALRRVNLGNVSGRPLLRITPPPLGGWHLAVKRAVDVIGATVGLLLTAPVMAIAAVAILIEDGSNPFFTQRRVGKGGKPFTIYKFRTMVMNAEQLQIDLTNDHEGPVFKMTGDPRITRVGGILRTTSIDELPQLVNILRGDMSLVGPRPLPIHEVEAAPASFLDRHAVKPGLTGRWQVSGRSDTDFDQLDELDRWYVDNWSLGQDLEILARTVPAVLLARGAK